ncbi:MAG: methyltransferase domain-containing protein [Candidatus Aminicenantes bacterium]|nr:methyltransferase domain-containing protein [Candidatus Aminicenantes bacterium]
MKITEELSFDEARIYNLELKEKIKKVALDFIESEKTEREACLACQYPEYSYAFEIQGFHYVQCKRCSSLYLKNPITDQKYRDYRSRIFKLYRDKKIKEKLKILYQKKTFNLEINLNRLFDKNDSIGIGFSGLKYTDFMKELQKIFPRFLFSEVNFKERTKYDFIMLDNLIESLIQPKQYLKQIYSCLKPGGYLYMTSRLGSGIDILLLWENSKLIPTEHLNLFSTEGILFLIKGQFETVDLSTPGILDVRLLLESDNKNLPPFLKYLKKHRGEEIIEDFQFFLQKNLLSSYLVLLAKKSE